MIGNASDSVLSRLRTAAARTPRRVLLESASTRITFAELDADTDRFAVALAAMGVSPGHRVILLLGNSLTFVQAYLGCLKAGAVVVPCNPAAPPAALADVQRDCQSIVTLDDSTVVSLLRRTVRASPPQPPPVEVLAAIIYTSGTTGRPKGVMLSHRNLLEIALAGQDMLQLDEDDRIAVVAPLFHLYGLREIDLAIVAGAAAVLPQHLTYPAHVLKQIQSAGVTGFSAVPSGLSLMLERCGPQLAACAGRLRYLTMGTAPASATLLSALRSLLPATRLITTYGLTEMSRVCWHEVRDPATDAGVAGRPYRGVEIRLQEPGDGRGRVSAKSAMGMMGYWNLPEQTRKAFNEDGFLLTPDRGSLDPDGTLRLLGRIDDVINCGGEKISPDEVEEILLSHSDVAGAAVVAAPDPAGVLGEVVRAVVVRRAGAAVGVEELMRHVAGFLEPHKVPRRIDFVEHLPLTELGKPRRALLRDGEPGASAPGERNH